MAMLDGLASGLSTTELINQLIQPCPAVHRQEFMIGCGADGAAQASRQAVNGFCSSAERRADCRRFKLVCLGVERRDAKTITSGQFADGDIASFVRQMQP